MGKYLDMARKLEEQKADSLGSYVGNHEPVTFEPMEFAGRLDFIDHLTEVERGYYLDLLEIMESPKFGLDRETAEREAGAIIARNRQSLQLEQATKDYSQDGYIKIFSTVLNQAVFLVRDEKAAGQVPDQSLPAFTVADMVSVKGLKPSEALVLMEAQILLGGRIKIENGGDGQPVH